MLGRLGPIALIALFTLAACAGDDAGGVALQTLPTSAAPAATATPIPSLDALHAAPGTLVFAEGSTLYAYPHGDAAAPVPVADKVDTESLTLTPGGAGLLYASVEQDRTGLMPGPRTIFHVDLATLQQIPFFETPSGLSVLSWSPDEQWALLRVGASRLAVARLDGSRRYEIPDASGVQARWLADNSLLLGGPAPLDSTTVTVSQQPFSRFEPLTGQGQALSLDAAALSGDRSALEVALASYGLALAEEEADPRQPVLMRSEQDGICDTWHISYWPAAGSDQPPDIVYSAANVYRLSVPTTLPDSALLFLETRLAGCQIANLPQTTLMLLPAGGEVVVLAEDVSDGPHERGAFMTSYGMAVSYAASPDGRYVAWIGGGVSLGWSSLELLDLATGERTRLAYKQRGDGGSASFSERDVFNSVLWAGG